MASANHDANHVKLSRKIQDPVAAAATNGNLVSSALRNDYLNRANSFIQLFFRNRPDAEVWLRGLIKEQTITFASAGTAVDSDFSYELACTKEGTTDMKDRTLRWIEPTRKTALDNKLNPNNQDCFLIYNGLLFGYVDGDILTSGTGTLKYVQDDQKASAGASSDIAIDKIWHPIVVDIAATFFFEDRMLLDYAQAQERRANMIFAISGKG